jgi:hypothetical protein
MITAKGGNDWIKDLNLPETSTYSGQVRWSVSALPSLGAMATTMGLPVANIKEIVMGDVALPMQNANGVAIEYLMRKNGNQLEIEMKNAQPPMTLVGELRNNQIVFRSGNSIAFTVKFDPLAGVTLANITPQTVPGFEQMITNVQADLVAGMNTLTPQWDAGNATSAAAFPEAYLPMDAEDALDANWLNWDNTPPSEADYRRGLFTHPTLVPATYANDTLLIEAMDNGDFTYASIENDLVPVADATAIAILDGPNWANLPKNKEFNTGLTVPQLQAIVQKYVTNYADKTAHPNLTINETSKPIDIPVAMNMQLYEQIKTTDKGGNTVIRGRSGVSNNDYPDRADVPTVWVPPAPNVQVLTYGDISFTIGNTSNMDMPDEIRDYFMQNGFNEVMAVAGAQEETAFIIGQIVLAKFQNAAGLMEAGTSMFTSTNNSGEPILAVPGLEGTGQTAAGQLEMSNVDISKEFTDMITTQRGFQANSRIVTVSDEMLQELVNLKR